ncbi:MULTISPECIES: aKG-HExxH-type peptide beta-hydroxylase [unclassified Amycolatopsis]|uniref:aKG-HExxH-type peptide beta-hydroxylase n=1 Tax=unclassified Amycolatopsis TaxID=2618356 RepID=UPI002E14CA95|nr:MULTISPECIES: HEXXH motif-containing putative peptide modification protein [unclassified Amycolatopsis]WSK77475.1 HEXXH motif-containing putative peptide modification protein [Amycolatopsis sp. NBC_01286]
MTTISPTVPFSPVPKESDASVARFAEFRLAGLGRFAGLLGSRLPAAEAALLERGARLAAELDRPEWTDIALHPYYSYWWSRLSQAVAAGRAAEVTSLVPELSRFLLIPLLRRGDVDLALPPPRAGELRFPGHRRHLRVEASGALRARATNGELVLTGHDAVPVAELLDEYRPGPGVLRPAIPGTAVELDSSDPWVGEFFEVENVTAPSPGRSRDDLAPAAADVAAQTWLGGAVDRLGRAWPEMRREFEDYVRLVAPFSSQVRAAFTNVGWQGAVFLRTTVHDDVQDVERLVHETSHLRLNLVMARTKLYDHDAADRVPSPFRAGLRPIMGLYHGAFVVTRAARALDRVHRLAGDLGYAERIPVLVTQVRLALGTLRRDVRLTPDGAALLDEADAHITDLAAAYGAAAPDEPKIYEEF